MTLKFYNGTETDSEGNPLYRGETFETATEFLTKIRDNLSTAGWSIEDDEISTNSILKMRGFDEDQESPKDECFIQIYSDTAEQIKVKMYFDNSGTIEESPDKIFNFYENEVNRFYLTCDSGAGVLLILRSNSIGDGLFQNIGSTQPHPSLKAIHFGFLQRVSFDDKSGIALGEPDFRLHNCYMEKTYHESKIWENVLETWYIETTDYDYSWGISGEFDYRNSFSGYYRWSFPSHTTTDFLICSNPSSNREGFGGTDGRNSGYMAFKGGVNGVTGLPFPTRFGYIEGHGDGLIYGDNMATPQGFPFNWYFRGWVKFVANGFGTLQPLQQIKENNGDRWISTGRAGHQAMLIDQVA